MKTRYLFTALLSASLAGVLARAADRAWVPTAGGAYAWNDIANWGNGLLPNSSDQAQMRTTGQTGDQSIHLANAVAVFSFFPGSTDNSMFSQIFSGASISPNTNFRVMGGRAILENSVRLDGGVHHVGLVQSATLTVRNSGCLISTNCAELRVGSRNTSTTYFGGAGALYVEEGGLVQMRGKINSWSGGLLIGYNESAADAGNPGKVWQSGGTVDLQSQWYVSMSADGYYRLDGGLLSLPTTPQNNSHRIGCGGATYGLLHVSSGTLALSKPVWSVDGNVLIGFGTITASAAARSEVYLSGGTVSVPDRAVLLAGWTTQTSGTVAHEAVLTVDGDAVLTGRNIGLGNTASPAVRATLNLNGGLVDLSYYLSRWGGANNQAAVNFNGGTLRWRPGVPVSPISGISNITVFARGGTIDAGASFRTEASFRTAKGYGVGAITVSNPGSGYGAAPRVVIAGGSGSNATAVAVMSRTGTVERVAVTCPGEGYAPADVLSVSFVVPSSGVGYGGGAQAGVTLAAQGTATFTKKGEHTWTVAETNGFDGFFKVAEGYLTLAENAALPALNSLVLAGGTFTGQAGIDDAVNAGATLRITGGNGTSAYRMMHPETAGDTNAQSFAVLEASRGFGAFSSANSADGVAEMLFPEYTREGALLSFTPTDTRRMRLNTSAHLSPSAVSPIVSGFVSQDGMNVLERDPGTGYLRVAATSGTPSPDSNYLVPNGFTTGAVTSVNSLLFPDNSADAQFWFDTAGAAKIVSGMIVSRRDGGAVQRVATLAGGTLTTDDPGGLVIVERGSGSRSLLTMDSAGARRFLISTTLADPDAQKPMAVTLAGARGSSPSRGALIRLMAANTFSGGLYLANGGVWYDGDAMLGGAGGPVIVSGLSSMTPSGNVLETAADRPIEIGEEATLQLLARQNHGAVIRGPLSGAGSLITGEENLRTYTSFGGNHNSFTGVYYIVGAVRAGVDGSDLSPAASIRFADNASGFGTLDIKGTFTRPLGTGAGAVCWQKHPLTGGLYGGFSAYGGDLTVNLHGDGRSLVYGSPALPGDAVLYLQNRNADGRLTFENGLDLNGRSTPHIRVSTDLEKTVYFKGVISDSVGGGMLTKGGQGVLVLEHSPTFNGKLSITSGKVRLAEGVSLDTLSEVSITGDGKALEIMGTQTTQRVAGMITGTGALTVSEGSTVILQGTNSYAGVTTVTNNSVLLVEGEHAGGGAYHVTGTLGGSGTVAPAASTGLVFGPGSRISPGGPGVIGTLTLGTPQSPAPVGLTDTALDIDLAAETADQLVVAGNLTVSGDTRVVLAVADDNLLKSLRGTVIPVCRWAGQKVGSFTAATNIKGWRVIEDLAGRILNLVYVSQGTMISVQ